MYKGLERSHSQDYFFVLLHRKIIKNKILIALLGLRGPSSLQVVFPVARTLVFIILGAREEVALKELG